VLERTLADLEPLRPLVCLGDLSRAGAKSRQRTFDLVTQIQRGGHLTAMAHLICVGHSTRRDARHPKELPRRPESLTSWRSAGTCPKDPRSTPPRSSLHAMDLVELARETGDFAIGVAAHPLGHPRSTDLASDRYYLAQKINAGRLRGHSVSSSS